jgi:tetratricopeptide (TPR) repeat protein
VKNVTEFLSAITELLVVFLLIALFVLICIAIFRPPTWLRELARMWRESRRTVKRVKAAGIEAEFEDRESAPPLSAEAAPPATQSAAVTQNAAPESGAEDKFFEAIRLLGHGEYAEGMALMRETVAGETDQRVVVTRIALGQYFGFGGGCSQALGDLRATAANNPRLVRVRRYLADALAESGEVDAALQELRDAASLSTEVAEQAEIAARVASMLHRADRTKEAKAFIFAELRSATEPAARSSLALTAAKIFEGDSAEARDHVLALYEIARQSTPNDQSMLFDFAYAASNYDANGAAYILYKQLVARDSENAAALNNLGVAAERLQMAASAVRAYRRAEVLKHDLAIANLAQLLVTAGFLDDAAKLLETVRSNEKVDDHVLAVIGRLGAAREEDKKRNNELTSHAEKLSKWRMRHAVGLLGAAKADALVGEYVGSNGYKFTIESASTAAVLGTFEIDSSKSATFTGYVEGQLLLIRWRTVPAKPPAWYSAELGRGVLFIETHDTLTGFRIAKEKVFDVDDVGSWVSWSLRRLPSSA